MTFAAYGCATEGNDDIYDRYEYLLKKDPKVQDAQKRVREMIGCFRDVLSKGTNSVEALSLFDELDDAFVNLDDEKERVLIEAGLDMFRIAIELAQEYSKLETNRYRLRQQDSLDAERL